MIYYILPIINLIINGAVVYYLFALLSSYFEFEYFVAILFFMFNVLVSLNALFSEMFSFITKNNRYNMLFIVQFLASLLILQLFGWVFSVYLAFVMTLVYMFITNHSIRYQFMLELSGIVVGGIFLYINIISG